MVPVAKAHFIDFYENQAMSKLEMHQELRKQSRFSILVIKRLHVHLKVFSKVFCAHAYGVFEVLLELKDIV